MKNYIYILFIAFLVCAFNFGCVKKKDFPTEPHIEFKELDKFESHFHSYTGADSIFVDSIYCIVKFTDGDGDIGGNSVPDFKMVYLHDSISILDGTSTGIFVTRDDLLTANFDSISYTYQVPNISPNGQYKALEGEINARLRARTIPLNTLTPLYDPRDSQIKFIVTLRDRAGHISNAVTTSAITVP